MIMVVFMVVSLVVFVFVFIIAFFVIVHCLIMHDIAPHGTTALEALISSSTVVQEGSP